MIISLMQAIKVIQLRFKILLFKIFLFYYYKVQLLK
jgi:hypothetical protein